MQKCPKMRNNLCDEDEEIGDKVLSNPLRASNSPLTVYDDRLTTLQSRCDVDDKESTSKQKLTLNLPFRPVTAQGAFHSSSPVKPLIGTQVAATSSPLSTTSTATSRSTTTVTFPKVSNGSTAGITNSTRSPKYTAREEDALYSFDLNSRYGPCVGITRSGRWQRASKLGLDPPPAIAHILLQANSAESEISVLERNMP
eukprot:Lankesteria_metandrocarpae@DN4470_c0_g1_i2.p2